MFLFNLSREKAIKAQMAEARANYKGKVTKVALSHSGKNKTSKRAEPLDIMALPKELRDKFFK